MLTLFRVVQSTPTIHMLITRNEVVLFVKSLGSFTSRFVILAAQALVSIYFLAGNGAILQDSVGQSKWTLFLLSFKE